MPKNKLYTLSYFRKRLREAGILSDVVIDKFHKDDPRYWMLLLSRNYLNLFLICYKNNEDFFFKIQTPSFYNFEIRTKSMKVIIDSIFKIIEHDFKNKEPGADNV